jgi:hypothetical protein
MGVFVFVLVLLTIVDGRGRTVGVCRDGGNSNRVVAHGSSRD